MGKVHNILIIPHQPHRNIKVRALEMARYLAKNPDYRVYVLSWKLGKPVSHCGMTKMITRLSENTANLMTPIKTEVSNQGFQWVTMPYLLTPYAICQKFNPSQIQRVLEHFQIDTVINANAYHFGVHNNPKINVIYDVVDDHLSKDSGPAWEKTRAFTLNELSKANHILSITHALQEELKQNGYPESHRIPNGVDYAAFQQIKSETIESLRQRYQLQNQFCIAYIGNHGWWAGMQFMLDVFKDFHQQVPNSKLLIVGPGQEVPEFQKKYQSDSIVFTGAIPATEINTYFHLSDIGVLPFDLCPFTHNALPLKVLEYGAAKKHVLASELKELKTLNLPHIELLPLEKEHWVNKLVQMSQKKPVWDSEWNRVIQSYDWDHLFSPLNELIEGKDEGQDQDKTL